ncbi:MAG: CcdB family protein [Ectothiorhodospiraceae bacterium]
MAQLSVHRNPDSGARGAAPYLLVLQHDLLADLATVVVAPLFEEHSFGKPAEILHPAFVVEGHRVVLSTPELAGISRSALGEEVTTLTSERNTVMAALDLLFTGI